jgi:glycosyltransferase involved in cell wall biosynthesis
MHEVHLLANSPDEVDGFARLGEAAFLLNQNLAVSERYFFPVEDVPVEFDAIYNARLDPMKRIELAAAIDRAAYVTRPPWAIDPAVYAGLHAGIAARHPDHRILNPRENGLVRDMDAASVNRALGRAAVGLALSEVEGAMLASMEYMLAGLPIVSTPSKGGRDFFFDPEYCLVVPPDPRSVREAVMALKARAIPRAHIRTKTLARVESQRRSYLALLDEILGRLGHPPRFGGPWPWLHRRNFFAWGRVDDQFAAAEAERDRGRKAASSTE